MTTDVMISASGLSKRFGSVRALDKVSFEVKRGEVVGFLGPNGAGKSTAMRILTCFISPNEGTAQVSGHDVFDDPLGVRRALGYLPQRAPLYVDMSVREYLAFIAEIRGLDPQTFRSRLGRVIEVCGLAQSLNKQIGHLSHGYRQRVGLGQALIHDPPILILDEPTSDLDPNEKAEVLKYIKEIGKDRTILLSTHNLSEVEEACARVIIVSKGRKVADGSLEDIRGKSAGVRYVVCVEDKGATEGFSQVFSSISGITRVRELPSETGCRRFELGSAREVDARADIFRAAVQKGLTLLELHRDSQTLDAVFREYTRGDERLDRGLSVEDDGPEEPSAQMPAPEAADQTSEEKQ